MTPAAPRCRRREAAANDIDRFVLARLEREGLAPSPEADRETLINRVSLTLTGLPPTLEEVDAFVADASPDAYERLVDRLLASPAYARAHGRLLDRPRALRPRPTVSSTITTTACSGRWRDWVIGAFNRNMPFDEFATWQLAGDLLPNATREQKLATAFLRVGPRTTENGAIDERVPRRVRRRSHGNTSARRSSASRSAAPAATTTSTTRSARRTTTRSSRFFNSVDEPGFYPPGHSAIQAGPTLPWPDDATAEAVAAADGGGRAQRPRRRCTAAATSGRAQARASGRRACSRARRRDCGRYGARRRRPPRTIRSTRRTVYDRRHAAAARAAHPAARRSRRAPPQPVRGRRRGADATAERRRQRGRRGCAARVPPTSSARG